MILKARRNIHEPPFEVLQIDFSKGTLRGYERDLGILDLKLDEVELIAPREITDGMNDFNTLYKQRSFLMQLILNRNPKRAWKFKIPSEKDFFLVGVTLTGGNFSLYCPLSDWDDFDIPEVTQHPAWDGHTQKDIVRLKAL